MENYLETAKKRLAGEIMDSAREQLTFDLSFLTSALFPMGFVWDESVASFGSDGSRIYCNSDYVLFSFKRDRNECARTLLHIVLHFIFSHPFGYEELNKDCWDTAADLAAENVILELNLKDVSLKTDSSLLSLLKKLKLSVNSLTAENIYKFLLEHEDESEFYKSKSELFTRDDHKIWLKNKLDLNFEKAENLKMSEGQGGTMGCHDADEGDENEEGEEQDEALVGQSESQWNKITQQVKADLEVYSKRQGDNFGSLLLNLKAVLREKHDYTEFLKRFAVLGEEMHINDDEFDYIYYTYGLSLYKNIPLVEPLEYREEKRIREFVIAIDTSGSCRGKTVENFLKRTYSVLKNTESYFERVNIHIIQCDKVVQRDEKITSREEFERYMDNIVLSGFGGTDFRPVFEYTDGLIAKRELNNLRGLIYFTDGFGTFPVEAPKYETAFVFVDENYTIPQVPAWALKIVLREDEI
ncbi:MAG: VWA-like domain-containing protein [Clostridiales bacterium]|nr:VWA-like domain-containing protein [Clostridiales bacterium]